jgi:hypothetical protein
MSSGDAHISGRIEVRLASMPRTGPAHAFMNCPATKLQVFCACEPNSCTAPMIPTPWFNAISAYSIDVLPRVIRCEALQTGSPQTAIDRPSTSAGARKDSRDYVQFLTRASTGRGQLWVPGAMSAALRTKARITLTALHPPIELAGPGCELVALVRSICGAQW